MGIIFVNKFLFLHTAFPVMSLSAAHLALCAVFTRVAVMLGVFKPKEAKMDWIIALIALGQALAISLGQASLKMNSMGFFQLTKQMQVPLVGIIEYVWLGRTLSRTKICLLVAMTVGVCMSNMADVQFTYVGATMALAGTMCTSMEVVLYSWMQQSKGWETLQLLYKTMPYCSAITIVVALVNDVLPDGFFTRLLRAANSSGDSVPAIEFELFHIDAAGIILFLSSCALGICVNVSSCFVGGKASALAYAMLGLAKTITVIIMGIAFFDAPPTWNAVLGTGIAIASIVMYAMVTLREKQQAGAGGGSELGHENEDSGDKSLQKPLLNQGSRQLA